jgi:hypothetical protein
MGEIDWSRVEVVRRLMINNFGTKFYEVLVAWPLSDEGRIDTSKNALFITRYGQVRFKASGGCSGYTAVRNLFTKTITAKENKDYVGKPTGDKVSIQGKDARSMLIELGYMRSHSRDNESIRLF